MSWNEELCEECGEYKRVVVAEHLLGRVVRILEEASADRNK